MPGKRITDHQVLRYKDHRRTHTQIAAAAKVGISERSARQIEQMDALPSQRPRRQWRTRKDPLAAVWEAELLPLLTANPQLQAGTLLEELQRRYPEEYAPSTLRTLQRRVRTWRVNHGGEREIFFAQEHPPGRQGLSDFTVCNDLGVTIAGVVFPHRLYQFALAYSGWRHACLIENGESFEALSTGLQAALWRLGGAPEEHRTDSLSAAFKNLAESAREDFTQRYAALCDHYGMRASRCNPGESQENGSIESRHGSLKNALRQALLLRGSMDFGDRVDYETFVETIVQRMNRRVEKALELERAALRPLPERRTAEFTEIVARVSKYGIFTVKGAQYSAPSRLVGHRMVVRQYVDRIEAWIGGACVLERPRANGKNGQRHPRSIDYRDLVEGLRRKPGAFARWVLRDAVFPRTVYRQTWEKVSTALLERDACKLMVGLLALAANGHESELAMELEALLARNELPDLKALTQRLAPRTTSIPVVEVRLPELTSYDGLIVAAS
ncbi:MAG: IS21-like element ISCARN49 family transposase [Candidatus Eremiobacteraeota bacterium]|nr:IS21-like element ISCARN49 family transposase [Candidatus Eremiobacteraeota bacterium]